jgi:hypothetical protein
MPGRLYMVSDFRPIVLLKRGCPQSPFCGQALNISNRTINFKRKYKIHSYLMKQTNDGSSYISKLDAFMSWDRNILRLCQLSEIR